MLCWERTSRNKHDYEDLWKIQQWFNQYDPNQRKICSLSSGLNAEDDDCVNCDRMEQVGAEIHKQLDKASIMMH